VREERLHLDLDHIADVDDRVRVAERHEEEGFWLVRFEPFFLPELRQHLASGRVRIDRPKDDLTGSDVVGMVDIAASVPGRWVHREDHVRSVSADLARDGATHVDRRLEVAVFEVQEDDILHAEDSRGFALLRCANVAQTLARHVGIL